MRHVRRKRLKGKPKERVERYRSMQQKCKANRKGVVRQVLDDASNAKRQIDPEVIEGTYVEWFESVGPKVDLSDYPGPYSEEKWCQYWASQETQETGADTWLRFSESNTWIRAGTYTEGEAISALLLRTNCIPTRECTSRYARVENVQCRRCGTEVETTGHICGWCPSVKRNRILRHNSLCRILANKAVKAGWTRPRGHTFTWWGC